MGPAPVGGGSGTKSGRPTAECRFAVAVRSDSSPSAVPELSSAVAVLRVSRAASIRAVPVTRSVLVPVTRTRPVSVVGRTRYEVASFFPPSKKPNGRRARWVRTQGRTARSARRRRLGQSTGRFHCESGLSKSFAEPPASLRGQPSPSHRNYVRTDQVPCPTLSTALVTKFPPRECVYVCVAVYPNPRVRVRVSVCAL